MTCPLDLAKLFYSRNLTTTTFSECSKRFPSDPDPLVSNSTKANVFNFDKVSQSFSNKALGKTRSADSLQLSQNAFNFVEFKNIQGNGLKSPSGNDEETMKNILYQEHVDQKCRDSVKLLKTDIAGAFFAKYSRPFPVSQNDIDFYLIVNSKVFILFAAEAVFRNLSGMPFDCLQQYRQDGIVQSFFVYTEKDFDSYVASALR